MALTNREPVNDLRSWLRLLEEEEQLTRITERVHWDQELSGIARRTYDVLGDASPALMFENIDGYPAPGPNRLFIGQFRSWSRICMMLGLDPVNTKRHEIVRTLRHRFGERVAPVHVQDAAVHQNIETGDDINLKKFPVPFFNQRDGGRYFGTMHMTITKDLDTDWINCGLYRMQMHSENELGIYFAPGRQHIGLQQLKYMEAGEPMPVAIAIGLDPRLCFVAPANVPAGVSEFEVAGALTGEPVKLVKAKTVDLPVPADAEIVIEGHLHPTERRAEGPFGEYPGYYGEVPGPMPVIKVSAVTYRNDPIFQGSIEGHPVNESHVIGALVKSTVVWNALDHNGIPGIKDVACIPESSGGHMVISVKPTVPGHADWIASTVWGTSASVWSFKHLFVVDDDIDPWDLGQVAWAMAWRVKAGEDIKIWKNHRGSPIDPRQEPEMKGYWDRMLVDATRPFDWKPRDIWGSEGVDKGEPQNYPPTSRPAQETIDLVNSKWEKYGIEPVENFIGNPVGIMRNWWAEDGGED